MLRCELFSKILMTHRHRTFSRFMLCMMLCGCQVFVLPTDSGERLIAQGDYEQAITELTSLKPEELRSKKLSMLLARAHRSRAEILLKQGACLEAFNDLETAAQWDARLRLNYQQTETCFREGKKKLPLALARVLFDFGDLRSQVLEPILAAEREAENYERVSQLSRTLAARNRWTPAIARWLASEAAQRGELKTARFWLLKLLDRMPSDAYLLTRAGVICAQLKDDDVAVRLFSRAFQQQPNNPVVLMPWREVCMRRGDTECVQQINMLLIQAPKERELRPLPKSKR